MQRSISHLWRERILDTACWLAGIAGRNFLNVVPTFIIGTGRCGTTLLVDILKTHPNFSVFPGEANELWHCKLEPFETTRLIDIPPIEVDPKRFSEVSVANWPRRHDQRIHDIFAGFHLIRGRSKVLFTKSAMISFMIPTILKIFPNARFIHLYRSGPAVVESYFRKNFGKYSRFVFEEQQYRLYCAQYWNACILEIEQRKEELSLEQKGQYLEFSYEQLCDNSKTVLDLIAKFTAVTSDRFGFDISKISSRNYRISDSAGYSQSAELETAMSPAMTLKGYTRNRAPVVECERHCS